MIPVHSGKTLPVQLGTIMFHFEAQMRTVQNALHKTMTESPTSYDLLLRNSSASSAGSCLSLRELIGREELTLRREYGVDDTADGRLSDLDVTVVVSNCFEK